MKQFKSKDELEKWIDANFPIEYESLMDIDLSVDMEAVASKLASEGYDLDNLVADGHDYDVNGHTNNGWLWENEVGPDALEELRNAGRIRNVSIREKRIAAGLSKAEMSRVFEIPLRTLENWEAGVREPAKWVERLIIEKLDRMIGGAD